MKKHLDWLSDLMEYPPKGFILWLAGEDRKPYAFYQEAV